MMVPRGSCRTIWKAPTTNACFEEAGQKNCTCKP